MIFVTVGTFRFDNLIRKIDSLVEEKKINEEVICQISSGIYIPQNCQHFRLIPSITDYIKRASLVISHGGSGSLFGILKMGKRLIGVANPDLADNHQIQLLEKLSNEGFLLFCKDFDQLYEYIISKDPLRPYHNDNRELIKSLKEFIEDRKNKLKIE